MMTLGEATAHIAEVVYGQADPKTTSAARVILANLQGRGLIVPLREPPKPADVIAQALHDWDERPSKYGIRSEELVERRLREAGMLRD